MEPIGPGIQQDFRGPSSKKVAKADKESTEKNPELKRRLASMKREDFGDYLMSYAKEFGELIGISDFGTDVNRVYEVITRRPEFRGFTEDEIRHANESILEESKIGSKIEGTPRAISLIMRQEGGRKRENVIFDVGAGFLHWKFNKGTTRGAAHKKAWITLRDPIREITPELMTHVIDAVEASGFSGKFKIFAATDDTLRRFENFTIHADNDDEVDKAQKAVINALILNGVVPQGVARGEDPLGTSDNYALAQKICAAMANRDTAITQPPNISRPGEEVGINSGRAVEIVESESKRLSKLSRADFIKYLLTHAEEYGKTIDFPDFAYNQVMIRDVLTRRPELRGMSEDRIERILQPMKDFANKTAIYRVVPRAVTELDEEWKTKKHPNVRIEKTPGFMDFVFGQKKEVLMETKNVSITLRNPIREITRDLINQIVKAISVTKFDGKFKLTFQTDDLLRRFDNLVISGNSDSELEKVTKLVMEKLAEKGISPKCVERPDNIFNRTPDSVLAGKILFRSRR
ncbi:MAG: hypothetical protein WCJ29_01550 [bacterium]